MREEYKTRLIEERCLDDYHISRNKIPVHLPGNVVRDPVNYNRYLARTGRDYRRSINSEIAVVLPFVLVPLVRNTLANKINRMPLRGACEVVITNEGRAGVQDGRRDG